MDYAGKLEGASHESSGLAMRQAVPDSNAVMAHHYWSNSSAGDSVVTIKDETASLEHHPSNSLGPALHSTGFAPWSPTHTTTSGSVPQNNSSLQPKAKPLGRIKTLVRLLLVLIDLVTDLIFLVECYRPSTLSCLTYSAFPENEKKRQRLHNGILYGAWACASAAAVEFIVLCLLYRWRDYEPSSKLSSVIAFVGGCHDTVQVGITFLFNWYLGAGSLVAAISMLVSALMILLHWIHLLFKLEGVTLLTCCRCLCWGPCAYGLGLVVLLFVGGPFVPSALFGQDVTYIDQFNVTVQVSCREGMTGQLVTSDMLFMENYEWRLSPGSAFQNVTNTTRIGPRGSLPSALLNVTGKGFYWQTTAGWLNIFGVGPRKEGPRYLAMSDPIRNHSQDGNALLRDRGERFITAVHMARNGINVQIFDPYYMPSYCQTGARSDPIHYNCTDAAGYDFMLISKGVGLFQERFAYNLDGTTTYVDQGVSGEMPILCPQVIGAETQSYEALVQAGASVGSLVGLRVGLSMQGTYCRNAKKTAAATYLG